MWAVARGCGCVAMVSPDMRDECHLSENESQAKNIASCVARLLDRS